MVIYSYILYISEYTYVYILYMCRIPRLVRASSKLLLPLLIDWQERIERRGRMRVREKWNRLEDVPK